MYTCTGGSIYVSIHIHVRMCVCVTALCVCVFVHTLFPWCRAVCTWDFRTTPLRTQLTAAACMFPWKTGLVVWPAGAGPATALSPAILSLHTSHPGRNPGLATACSTRLPHSPKLKLGSTKWAESTMNPLEETIFDIAFHKKDSCLRPPPLDACRRCSIWSCGWNLLS